MRIETFVRSHFADAVLGFHDADVMPSFALIGRKGRDDSPLVFPDVFPAPLVNVVVVIFRCLHKLFIDVSLEFSFRVIVAVINFLSKVDDVGCSGP